jgi:hypothetical protein
MVVLRDEKGEISDFLMPTGMTKESMQKWTLRVLEKATKLNKQKFERYEGRTFRETWAIPSKVTPIDYNSANQHSFDVGVEMVNRIIEFGRMTVDELMWEFGAVDEHLLTMTVNMLRKENYLKDYTEKSGLQTLEAFDLDERNALKGLPPIEKEKVIKLSPALTVIEKPELPPGEDHSGGFKF